MSKILEMLNYGRKKDSGEVSDERFRPGNFDTGTKEKLANTYIFNQPKNPDNPKEEGTEEILGNNIKNEQSGGARFVPWVIAFLAVFLLILNMAYRGKVSINISFTDDTEPVQEVTGAADSMPGAALQDTAPEQAVEKNSRITAGLIAEGRLNSSLVRKMGFYGGAISRSRITRDGLILYNDGTTEWASVGLDLLKPMDFSRSSLVFFVKGVSGNESLELILRDIEAASYQPQAKSIIFNKDMARDWQFVSIPFEDFEGMCDTRNIKHIGFEFGTQTLLNEPGISIHIKNLAIAENAGQAIKPSVSTR